MRRVFLCAVLVMLSVSSAFGDATEELLKIAMDKNTTPKNVQNLIKFGADVNATDKNGVTALIFSRKIKMAKPQSTIHRLTKSNA